MLSDNTTIFNVTSSDGIHLLHVLMIGKLLHLCVETKFTRNMLPVDSNKSVTVS